MKGQNKFLQKIKFGLVLAELDLFVRHLDLHITTDTEYKRAVARKDNRVCDMNWLAYGWDKKEFCERECRFYGIYVHPTDAGPIVIKNDKLITPYNGRLTTVNLTYA